MRTPVMRGIVMLFIWLVSVVIGAALSLAQYLVGNYEVSIILTAISLISIVAFLFEFFKLNKQKNKA
jgi:hypothetical protein